jgi:uncharacterized protein DUF5367
MFMRRIALLGIGIYVAGTVAIRLIGEKLLQPGAVAETLSLYAVSFILTAFLVRLICRRLVASKEDWAEATTLLVLPTLILDPFSCLFFSSAFPNLDPAAAGLFGGWMLICCGGGVTGIWVRR